MIATLLLLALGWAPQATEQMRVRPSSEIDAVRELEATCVAHFDDLEGLKRAAAASSRGYALEDPGDAYAWRNWTSPYGTIHYYEGGPASSRLVPECNLTSFTRQPVSRRLLFAEIEAMMQRREGSRIVRTEQDGHRAWSWYTRGGRPHTVVAVLKGETPNQIILSLRSFAVQSK